MSPLHEFSIGMLSSCQVDSRGGYICDSHSAGILLSLLQMWQLSQGMPPPSAQSCKGALFDTRQIPCGTEASPCTDCSAVEPKPVQGGQGQKGLPEMLVKRDDCR